MLVQGKQEMFRGPWIHETPRTKVLLVRQCLLSLLQFKFWPLEEEFQIWVDAIMEIAIAASFKEQFLLSPCNGFIYHVFISFLFNLKKKIACCRWATIIGEIIISMSNLQRTSGNSPPKDLSDVPYDAICPPSASKFKPQKEKLLFSLYFNLLTWKTGVAASSVMTALLLVVLALNGFIFSNHIISKTTLPVKTTPFVRLIKLHISISSVIYYFFESIQEGGSLADFSLHSTEKVRFHKLFQ